MWGIAHKQNNSNNKNRKKSYDIMVNLNDHVLEQL